MGYIREGSHKIEDICVLASSLQFLLRAVGPIQAEYEIFADGALEKPGFLVDERDLVSVGFNVERRDVHAIYRDDTFNRLIELLQQKQL
jgi:hypothetical protein